MSILTEVWVCEACGFQDELGNLPKPHPVLNWCPKCIEQGTSYVMITQLQHKERKRVEELRKQIYCRECGHMGPVESFPFDAPEEEEYRERRCPHCGSDNGVNASCVHFCKECRTTAAVEGDRLCEVCRAEEDRVLEESWRASSSLDYPDYPA